LSFDSVGAENCCAKRDIVRIFPLAVNGDLLGYGSVVLLVFNTVSDEPVFYILYPEDGGRTFLRKVDNFLSDYTAS
jgi:hypothetical protein